MRKKGQSLKLEQEIGMMFIRLLIKFLRSSLINDNTVYVKLIYYFISISLNTYTGAIGPA